MNNNKFDFFFNPTNEFKGAPFWAWNCKIKKSIIKEQIKLMKQMGFGGYHLHVRSGLETPYLSEEFLDDVKYTLDQSKLNNMYLYLYDEDRWPSGSASGMVTKNKEYAARYLLFTKEKMNNNPTVNDKGILLEGALLLASYKVIEENDNLISYKKTNDNPNYYAYLVVEDKREFLNNEPYVDTLNDKAIQKFADITYDAYKSVVGDEFGHQIPSIFTDEPQLHHFRRARIDILKYGDQLPYSDDFADKFNKAYGYNLIDRLPELFFNGASKVRYDFFKYVANRFANNYSGVLENKCKEVNLRLTGHLNEEQNIVTQTRSLGEAMHSYYFFDIPGIDILLNRYEFTTAKQCQSVVNQENKVGMTSELYGVSRWDNDFRHYKTTSDWQMSMGVSLRVPHLSLMSLKGFAKRDYPASIFYQSPFYKKYKMIEDHFAKVNACLSKGKTMTEIGVIHPVETHWLTSGRDDVFKEKCNSDFERILQILLKYDYDFDFISEALLPLQNNKGDYPLKVSHASYKTIIISNILTLRKTTLDRLISFANKGGKVIIIGCYPEYVDGLKDTSINELIQKSIYIPFKEEDICKELQTNRLFGIYENKKHCNDLLGSLKQEENGNKWFFLASLNNQSYDDLNLAKKRKIEIKIKGNYSSVILFDTLNNKIVSLDTTFKNGYTVIQKEIYNHDSVLLYLSNEKFKYPKEKKHIDIIENIKVDNKVPYLMNEDNCLLLDMAYYSLDGEPYSSNYEDVLKIDNILRKRLNYPLKSSNSLQPYAIVKTKKEHTLKLKFLFESIVKKDVYFAMEDINDATIYLNHKKVHVKKCGYYVDKAIVKTKIGTLIKGINEIELVLPYGNDTSLEWCYLLGSFGVYFKDDIPYISSLRKTLSFKDICKQGLPFYGGELTYLLNNINANKVIVTTPIFNASVIEVTSKNKKDIAFAPYQATINIKNNSVAIKAFISRQNAFGPIHYVDGKYKVISPPDYYKEGEQRTNKYIFREVGLLSKPILSKKK